MLQPTLDNEPTQQHPNTAVHRVKFATPRRVACL